jgi:hypothetical protein
VQQRVLTKACVQRSYCLWGQWAFTQKKPCHFLAATAFCQRASGPMLLTMLFLCRFNVVSLTSFCFLHYKQDTRHPTVIGLQQHDLACQIIAVTPQRLHIQACRRPTPPLMVLTMIFVPLCTGGSVSFLRFCLFHCMQRNHNN